MPDRVLTRRGEGEVFPQHAVRTVVGHGGEAGDDLRTMLAGTGPAAAVQVGRAVAGLAALILIGVSCSSLAYSAVTMLSAVSDDGYGRLDIAHNGLPGSVIPVIDPTSLETLTIRAAGARA